MSLLERYDVLLHEVRAELQKEYGDRVALAVFGSVGRGTPRDDSDVDLLIIAPAARTDVSGRAVSSGGGAT